MVSVQNVKFPLPPISYDPSGFATNTGLRYMDVDGKYTNGVPVSVEGVDVMSKFQQNDYGKLRAKIQVDKETARQLKDIHLAVLANKAKLFGENAKVSVPVWDEQLQIGFPNKHKTPFVVDVVAMVNGKPEDRLCDWIQVNEMLERASQEQLNIKMELEMNIWAQMREEGAKVG